MYKAYSAKRYSFGVHVYPHNDFSLHAADNDLTTNQITVTLITAGTLPDQISDTENSNEIRQLRDVCIFEVNGVEVYM